MQTQELSLLEVKKFTLKTYADERGFFRETFRSFPYSALGITCDFVQDNHSMSKRGVIRGMHFQRSPGQAKLVTVVCGKIFDVVVDVRSTSPTFGKWEGVMLDGALGEQLWIPVGFAHGFCVLSEEAHVCYKVSSLYNENEEQTFSYNDPFVGIEWPCEDPLLSEKDRRAKSLQEVVQ